MEGHDLLSLSLYFDDLIITRSNMTIINNLKKQMIEMFQIIDLGIMNYFIEMEIDQTTHLHLSKKYVTNIKF